MRALVPLTVLLVLTACSAAPTPVPTASSASGATCAQFGSAASVIVAATLGNAQGAVSNDEMAAELEKGKALLDEVQADPGSDLAAALEALKPVTASDLAVEALDGPDTEWDRQLRKITSLCVQAGTPVEFTMPGG